MRRILFFIALFNSICALPVLAQEKKGFKIQGHLKGLQNGEKILLTYSEEPFSYGGIFDSTTAENETFRFSGVLPQPPRAFWLKFSHHPRNILPLMLDNGDDMVISAGETDLSQLPYDISVSPDFVITGSQINDDFRMEQMAHLNCWVVTGLIDKKINQLQDSGVLKLAKTGMLVQCRNLVADQYLKSFLARNNRSVPLSISLFIKPCIQHSSVIPEIYDKLSDQDKQGYLGVLLKQKIPLCLGQPFPDFSLPSPDDQLISAKAFFAKNKMTIVEFWSSFSESRMLDEHQKQLLEVYQKYHGKGLGIIGVSSDDSKKKWNIAIQDLPWQHVSDLKGRDGIVNTVYHEFGPSNAPNVTEVLIDDKGKIIAWDVSGAELEWYLFNAFGE